MHPFSYVRAETVADATTRLTDSSALPLGGGTDLVVLLKEEIARPEVLVDVRHVPGVREITWMDDGGARIGTAVRVADVATDPGIAERFPALASACEAVGTPALRNMATIGGNLCQRPRCWYFRRRIPCHKNGGNSCPAIGGENQYHAILGGGPCFIVHPSDPAVALMALDAHVEIAGPSGVRMVSIGDFFVLPRERLDSETILGAGEIVTAVEVPGASAGGFQRYDKVMQRGAWDFALVSLAAVQRRSGDVRLVLGGVAPKPWRVTESVEEDLASGGLDADDVATLAERALYDAAPLSGNAYKVELAGALLRRAITELASRH